jgi:hypothetical protein
LKWPRILIADFNETSDRVPHFLGRVEAGAPKSASTQDAEPNFDLVKPGGIRKSKVRVHVGMPLEPHVPLRFMGIQIVEDDVDLFFRMVGHYLVHEMEELASSSAAVMACLGQPGCNVESRKKSGCSVAFIAMREAVKRPAVREFRSIVTITPS